MRPALKPGLATVWRNRDTVQIGIDPRRAIALTGMRGAAGLLRLLDGSRDRHQVLAAAGDLGMDAGTADRVLSLLAAAGALDDFPAGGHETLPAGTRARLAPELATTSLAHRDADGGARTLARRQAARVRVHGASRASLWIAGLLSAAGGLGVHGLRCGAAGLRSRRPRRPAWFGTVTRPGPGRDPPDGVILADATGGNSRARWSGGGAAPAASASEAITVWARSCCPAAGLPALPRPGPRGCVIRLGLPNRLTVARGPLACDTVLATMVAAAPPPRPGLPLGAEAAVA
jgi:hypothetical protein